MTSTAQPTQSSDYTDTYVEPYSEVLTTATSMDEAADTEQMQTIDPNAILLAEALTDAAIGWRIHNCKVSERVVTKDQPLPFLYHYDSLDDVIKQANPLTPKLLAQFNTPMTVKDAAALIGIDDLLITSPWHVKVVGSLVVFSEALQLAVRLHWTNTAKASEQLYTQKAEDAMLTAFKDWQFFGRVDVLYKNDKQALISVDEYAIDSESAFDALVLSIESSTDYQLLPATHALTIINRIESEKHNLPWFEAAILERIE